MPQPATCKVCGAVMPRRYPANWLTWLLAVASVLLVLLVPTLVGFSTVEGGLLIFVGIVGAVVALLLFLRAERTCEACRVKEK